MQVNGIYRQKCIFFMWIMFALLCSEYFEIYNQTNQSRTKTTMKHNEVMGIRARNHTHDDTQQYLPSSIFLENAGTKYVNTGQNVISEYEHILQYHTPSKERMRHLNSISSPTQLVHEMQTTALLILQVILKGIKTVVLLDLAQIENKGDPAINYGELELLSKLDIDVVYHGCYFNPIENLYHAREMASSYKRSEVAVLSSGGGNLGIYEFNDDKRIKILEIFHEFKFILLSQSIWFGGDHPSDRDLFNLQQVKASYEKHPDATILLRDQWSYDYCKEKLPMVKLYLAPDMAFGIGKLLPQFVHQPLYDIVWMTRRDQEAPSGENAVMPSNISYIQEDWFGPSPTGQDLIDWTYMMVHNAALFLLRGKVIVTDRLHGFILATLANKPVIIIDNKINKISHFADSWCKGLNNYQWASGKQEAVKMTLLLLKQLSY